MDKQEATASIYENGHGIIYANQISANRQEAKTEVDYCGVGQNQGLGDIVKNLLNTYFKNLNGTHPGCNLYENVLREVEKPVIEITLQYVNFNQKKASEILGMNRNTLKKKMLEFGISK